MLEVLSAENARTFDETWSEIAGPEHFWVDWRARVLLRQLQDIGLDTTKPLRALDIGGGQGILRKQLENETSWTVDCADIDMGALRRAEASRGRTLFYDIFDRKQDMLSAYDVVLVYDVIEHLPEPRPFLDCASAYLRPGGWLLLNVPALPSAHSRYDDAIGHLRRYGQRSLASELPAAVRSHDVRYWGFTLLPILYLRTLMLALTRASHESIVRKGFRPPGALVNQLLKIAARLESGLWSRPWLGTSVMLAGKKSGI